MGISVNGDEVIRSPYTRHFLDCVVCTASLSKLDHACSLERGSGRADVRTWEVLHKKYNAVTGSRKGSRALWKGELRKEFCVPVHVFFFFFFRRAKRKRIQYVYTRYCSVVEFFFFFSFLSILVHHVSLEGGFNEATLASVGLSLLCRSTSEGPSRGSFGTGAPSVARAWRTCESTSPRWYVGSVYVLSLLRTKP